MTSRERMEVIESVPVLRPSRTMIVYLLIFATVGCTAAGQLLIKAGVSDVGTFPKDILQVPAYFWGALTNVHIMFGLACSFCAALSWIGAVSRSDISFAYPFMILPVVIVLALSGVMFGEQVSWMRWFGVFVVSVGLFIVARG